MEVSIVPTAPEHGAGFRRALDIVARERKYLILQEAPPLEEMRAFVANIIAKGDVQVVAIKGGEVVGWCDIRRRFFPSQSHSGTLGMGIVPDFRGQGLGRRLLAEALKRARAARFTRIDLDVFADNARAIALYEKAGFKREGVLRDSVLMDGCYRDAIPMAIVDRSNAN